MALAEVTAVTAVPEESPYAKVRDPESGWVVGLVLASGALACWVPYWDVPGTDPR